MVGSQSRDTTARAGSTNGGRRPVSIGIVGAGFGGIGTGIRLRQQGIDDFTIFERADGVGGVWRANSYPGAACDVPSHLYSFSFARGTEWSRRYSPRADIIRYLERLVDQYGLGPHLRFGTELSEARFDEAAGRWEVRTADDERHEFDALVTACGQLTNPAVPVLPGMDEFEGHSFHSARWDHDYDLTGRDVVVVGAGASAIQFVPEIAPKVRKLTVLQRSAPWILPKADRAYREWERELFDRFPPRVALARGVNFAFFELATYGFTGNKLVARPFAKLAGAYRRKALRDRPDLLEKTAPNYEFGCKRVLFTSDWYPTLTRENVELVNEPIHRVTARGIVGADGVERPADTIIWGTGFRSHDFVAPMRVHGLGGRELNEVWEERPEAYLGTTVTGFPNFFVLYGPNTNHGSGSVPYTHECQLNYAIDGIRRLRDEPIRYLDLRPEVQAAWREEIADRSRNTQWILGGCDSWYLNGEGVNTNNWPGPWLEFRRRTRRLDPSEYRVAPAEAAAAG